MSDSLKQTHFGYQNKITSQWLRIEHAPHRLNHYFVDTPMDASKYLARNVIEEDFDNLRLTDREDWKLKKIQVTYKVTDSEI